MLGWRTVLSVSRRAPHVLSRLLIAVSCMVLTVIIHVPLKQLLLLAYVLVLNMLVGTGLRGLARPLSILLLPLAGVSLYGWWATGSPMGGVIVVERILVFAFSSTLIVSNLSVDEVLWLSSKLGGSSRLSLVILLALRSASTLRLEAELAREGLRTRGVGVGWFKKTMLLARSLLFRAIIKAEGAAETLALGAVSPERLTPLRAGGFGLVDALLVSTVVVLLLVLLAF